MLAFEKEVVERAWQTHYQDQELLMVKAIKLRKDVQMVQIEVQELQLQINIDWEAMTMAKQTKVKLYDQLIKKGLVELGEALEKGETELTKWHFEQVKNYVIVLDVAYQQITLDENTKDDAAIKGEVKQVKEEGKSIEAIKKGKNIPTDANIVDIFDEDETTPLSQLCS